ncbi:MAG: DUF2232 domain-containing protein [Pseudobdellovibrionaceae bacterium]|nr:DUF2232 domain-containing protein [Pseudobdellovibrionaceae bacterium]
MWSSQTTQHSACSAKQVAHLILAAILGLFISVLAAPWLRVLHQNTRRWIFHLFGVFWVIIFLAVPLLAVPALVLSALWWSVPIYRWFELRFPLRGYHNMFWSGVVTTLFAFLLVGTNYFVWGIEWIAPFLDHLAVFDEKIKPLNFSIKALLPSLFFFINLTNLVFAVALDKKIAYLMGCPLVLSVKSPRLFDFRVWEYSIWPFMVGLLLAVMRGVSEPIRLVAANVTVVTGCLFFFQGLAVIESLLYLFRVGFFLRILVYVLIAPYLFVVGLVLGLIDYWVDIRTRVLLFFRMK